MNKKGFTLVELIAVIVIIGILGSVAVISVSSLMNKFKTDYYERIEKSVESAAREYVADHKNLVYDNTGKTRIDISILVGQSYISDINVYNKKNQTCSGSIKHNKNNNTFSVCLICDGENHGNCN